MFGVSPPGRLSDRLDAGCVMRGLKIFLVGFLLLIAGGYAWDWAMTKIILRQRDYTMALHQDMRSLALVIRAQDMERE